MKKTSTFIGTLCAVALVSTAAMAGVCDYRPSAVLGQGSAAVVAGAGAATAAGGGALKAAGVYTLVHAGSGLTMLGSTAAGASAAGTVGIIAGTGGVLGTVGAVLLAPATIVVAGVTAVGVGGLEAACFFTDERVTDYDAVFALMAHLAEHHPEDRFRLVTGISGRQDDAIRIWNPETEELDRYLVADLYLVNGTLMHREFGFNRNLGRVALVTEVGAPTE
ncbi:hypothetical protein [Rhodobaculum claviforme]|uniref:Lipoprotein n=1 Tax=Rhodobaculum claviforme TaxID=1549854 RepID=A0A934TK68_9RHOB|nr:hypothetical protein [Rhodobaculum claviforme]MBK5927280.1 hypothetical protein [Rhodobaculum claviforme]